MITKIITGGQTGVDRAALDCALALGIPCGGWCPKGRLAEDGPIPSCYPLQETPSAHYAQRTEWNVRDADGTLIVTDGPPTGGTRFTMECARRLAKPCFVADLKEDPPLESFMAWLRRHDIRVLNIAGPRESYQPEAIYYRGSRRPLHRQSRRSLPLTRAKLAGQIPTGKPVGIYRPAKALLMALYSPRCFRRRNS